MGVKDYEKGRRTDKHRQVLNSDRGTPELDENQPAGHSGTVNGSIAFAAPGGVVAPIAIPAGFWAMITRVGWMFNAAPAGAGDILTLDDGTRIASVMAIDTAAVPYGLTKTDGNGSGVIARVQGNLTVNLTTGAAWPNGTVFVTYYLVPTV